MAPASIPAFANSRAGTAAPMLEALRRNSAFVPTLLDGVEIAPAVARALAGGARCVVVSGSRPGEVARVPAG